MQSCNLITEPLRTDNTNGFNIESTWRESYMQKLVPNSFRIIDFVFNLARQLNNFQSLVSTNKLYYDDMLMAY